MKLILTIHFFIVLLLESCTTNTVQVKNEKQGHLKASVQLEVSEEKKFALDDSTANNPEYTQIYGVSDGTRYFTFLNSYTNSIYFYDYSTTNFTKKISWGKNGPKGIPLLKAYHIKSLDSIYLYNKHPYEIVLVNDKGHILHKTSLMINPNNLTWNLHYPQYLPQTTIPFIETAHELLLNGFYFGVIPESIIPVFKFTARLDFRTNQLRFSHIYPRELYGYNYNWYSDMLTLVYYDLHPDGDKLVLSFPVSHNLYIADLNTGEYKKVYAGSNFATTICSINNNKKNTPTEEVIQHFMKNDSYTAVKYDKFRKVYYRFLLKAFPETIKYKNFKEKSVAVIVMDENFNYLGETTIGIWENWNWQNSFVTREGLNVEYLDKDPKEAYLTLKIFTIKKI
jgi:hypothetical protein